MIPLIPLPEISEQIVQQFQKKLESNKLSIATMNRYLATLKTILKYHQQPTHFIRLRKERNGRIRVISKEEEQQVCFLLRSQDNYFPEVADLVELLLDTGMRLSEALNLDFKDISFKNNLISIWINKGDKPRSIPMTKRVRQLLDGKQEKPFNLSVNQCEYAWSWVRKQMELEADKMFVIHACRHTTASIMVSAGIDLYVVKEILGHSSIQVTERYAHLAPGKLVSAIEVLEV
jgi:site-specific recombinase XerD